MWHNPAFPSPPPEYRRRPPRRLPCLIKMYDKTVMISCRSIVLVSKYVSITYDMVLSPPTQEQQKPVKKSEKGGGEKGEEDDCSSTYNQSQYSYTTTDTNYSCKGWCCTAHYTTHYYSPHRADIEHSLHMMNLQSQFAAHWRDTAHHVFITINCSLQWKLKKRNQSKDCSSHAKINSKNMNVICTKAQ